MKKSELRSLIRETIKSKEKFSVIAIQTGEVIDNGLPKDVALKLAAKKKGWAIQIDESVNENGYPTSAPRVYVLMLGNRSRGTSGPYRIYADKAAAEAEAAKQEAEGKDTRAFVQDLPFIK